ncbi:DNA repair protein RadA [hydrothermal vent metagenome]|uniref:DNA repair protein RadA n=1 Tax=hydrothermal vent metagenome TaxID=652676 RepID=A0A3B0RVR5_9ZZZZ
MVKLANIFVCQSCGSVHGKWAGRCDSCGGWNTLVEEIPEHQAGSGAPKRRTTRRGRGIAYASLQGSTAPLPRMQTGIAEFDRVCGGGIVPGSALLVGGDPGIGKSTLMLQAAAKLAMSGKSVIYISGEESIDQVRLRAKRLRLADAPLQLASETALGPIMDSLKSERPDLVVMDSMQTLWSDALAAAPGTVAQVRACAQELTRFAKKYGTAVVLIGHVTKDGQIAGPRVVEHMVDAVLYFEGDKAHQFRILRGVKNRFGPTDEIGVFEMGERGLGEVPNPSSLFLDGCENGTTGSAVFAGMEGTRPVLTEVQALIAPSALGTPRRAVVGWDSGRLAMVMAVLEARCGISFAGKDVYLNVAGGLKISEPAADLAVAAALVSSAFDQSLPPKTVVFGEIALSGTIRQVSRSAARLKEAAKLGFTHAMIANGDRDLPAKSEMNCTIAKISKLGDLVSRFEAPSPQS